MNSLLEWLMAGEDAFAVRRWFVMGYCEAQWKSSPIRGKNDQTAKKIKDASNRLYMKKDFEAAHNMYITALAHANYNGEVYGTILANISSCMFEMEDYGACIDTIDATLASAYSKNLRPKLHVRKIQALVKINRKEQAKTVLDAFTSSIGEFEISKVQQKNYLTLALKALEETEVIRFYSKVTLRIPDFDENPHILSACKKTAIRCNEYGRHIVAKELIKMGECILFEKPYVSLGNTSCPNCFKYLDTLVTCKTCTKLIYCSEHCRDADYNVHKWECKFYQRSCGMDLHVLGCVSFRVFLKGLVSGYKRRPMRFEDELKFGDRSDNFQYVRQLNRNVPNPVQQSDIIQMCCAILAYIDQEKDLKDFIASKMGEGIDLYKIGKHLLGLIAVCKMNGKLYIEGDKDETSSFQLHPTYSLFNHSCEPNTSTSCIQSTLIIKAIHDIPAGEQIFINYLPGMSNIIMSKEERKAYLLANKNFTCKCKKCSAHYQEDGHLPCPKCNKYAIVENCKITCNLCHKTQKVPAETQRKLYKIIDVLDLVNETNTITLFLEAAKLADEIKLNPTCEILLGIYTYIVIYTIKCGDWEQASKYMPYTRIIQFSDVQSTGNMEITLHLHTHVQEARSTNTWHTWQMTKSTLNEFIKHVDFLRVYFDSYMPTDPLLKTVETLRTYFEMQRAILEFQECSRDWIQD